MLILSRQCCERIVIDENDENIKLAVVAIRGERVKLGLCAPRNVEFHRAEFRERSRPYPKADEEDHGSSVRPDD